MSVNREWLEKDYYAVLGVPKEASQAEIKKAYRRLAQKHHPDANRGDKAAEERFKEVSTAYDVLGDASKRQEYDRIRSMASAGFRYGPGPTGGVRFEDLGFDAGGLGDIFDLFGRGSRRASTRGSDLETEVRISFEDGARIRLSGRGEPGPSGGRPGDLFVSVRVAPHKFFGRRGPDLTLELPITYPEAALGANVKVPTLNGAVTLKIPSGTSQGRTFRVRGRGASKRAGGKGDLLVTVQVEVPSRLSKEERELLERFREKHRASPRSRLGVSE